MPSNLQIVFSRFTDQVSEAEFNAWYDAHLAEILSIPGFRSAQRYRLEPEVVDEGAAGAMYRYLAVYEVDSDPDALRTAMESMKLATADSYRDRKDAGDDALELPPWWDQIQFASWNCIAIGDRAEAGTSR